MEGLQLGVATVVGLLAVAMVVGILAERLRIPYSVALLLASVPFQIRAAQTHFAPSLLFVFLPALVFEAAWNVDRSALLRHWFAVAVLALPGVIITALFTGAGLYAAGLLPLHPALLLGAILAATDPIAVIPVLRRASVPANLAAVIEGESLFNDGVAIVLYGVFVAMMVARSSLAPLPIAAHALTVSIAGAGIGVACALLAAAALLGTRNVLLKIVATIVAGYGAYLIADRLNFSGIFAAVAAGIALQRFERDPATGENDDAVTFFWGALAFVANSLVFLLMGLRIELARLAHSALLIVLTLALIAAARVFLSYVVLPLAGAVKRRAWQHAIALSGMRGALSVALVLALPPSLAHRSDLVEAVYGTVLISLVVQGLAVGPVLRRLALQK